MGRNWHSDATGMYTLRDRDCIAHVWYMEADGWVAEVRRGELVRSALDFLTLAEAQDWCISQIRALRTNSR